MDVRCKLRSEAYGQDVGDDDDDDDKDDEWELEGAERWGGAAGRGDAVVDDEDWEMGDAFSSDHDENETIGTQRRRSGK